MILPHLNAPTTLHDMAEDGRLNQAHLDWQFNRLLGAVTATEISREGDSFAVRFGRKNGSDLTFPAIDGRGLLSSALEDFGISVEAGEADALTTLYAARTVHGDQPGFWTTFDNGDRIPLIIRSGLQAPRTLEEAVRTAPALPTKRQVHAFAVAAGITQLNCEFRDDLLYGIPNGQVLDDLVEKGRSGTLGSAGPGPLAPQQLATYDAHTWRWSDGPLRQHLCEFGLAQGIPALVVPQLDVATVQGWQLLEAVKPLAGTTAQHFAQLSAERWACNVGPRGV